jgi:hypothetical protein
MLGMVYYLRERGADRLGAAFGAIIFSASGYFSWHFAGGHVSYYGLTMIPWILICLDRSRHRIRYGIWVGVLLASTFLMAGAYSYPFQVLLVAIHVLIFTIRDRSLKPLLASIIAAVVSLGLAGWKTLPVLEFTLRHSRPSRLLDSLTPWELVEMLLSRSHAYGRWGNHPFTWPEYGAYIGYMAFGLALIAIVLRPRRYVYYIALMLLFAAICLGKHEPISPYIALRQLPVFKDLRVPSRYIVFVVFYFAILSAFALTIWRKWMLRSKYQWLDKLRVLPPIVALIGIVELLSFSSVEFFRTYNINPHEHHERGEFYQTVISSAQIRSYLGPFRNIGIYNCYEEAANPRSPYVRLGRVAQIYLAFPQHGQVKLTRWTPNAVSFTATLQQPALVVLNQNYDPGWQITGQRAVTYRGLTAFQLPAGQHTLTARYLPTSFLIGVAISFAILLSILIAFFFLRRREDARWYNALFP